jgi:ammonium transporter Rh
MFIGVEIMMFIGFGYLMTFLKWYGLGAVGFTMMITAVGLQYYVFAESFFYQAFHNNVADDWHLVEINIYSLLNALYGISAVLISFGALIGKISPIQLLVMTGIELTLHAVNYTVLMTGILNVVDVGGTYADHMFGAYFGLAVAYVLGKPSDMPDLGNTPDVFSLLGTLFLWVYWPSFVAGAVEAGSDAQQRAIVNTILALSGSTVAAFWGTSFLSKDARFRPVDIQNATLAGGVAIGCVANLHVAPFGAVFIGCAAGFMSTVGYNLIMPWLEERYIHDTCGIHNLHAMPSVIGAIASVILAAYKGTGPNTETDADVYGNTAGDKLWWHQLLGIFLCLSFAISTGLLTGLLLRYIGRNPSEDTVTTGDQGDKKFNDNVYWEVADDYGRTMYTELLALVQADPEQAANTKDSLRNQVTNLQGHMGRRSNHSDIDSYHGSNKFNERHPVMGAILTASNHRGETSFIVDMDTRSAAMAILVDESKV